MKLKVYLKVSANELFEQLMNLILEDIKNSTGESITIDKLHKDFSYEKSITNQVGNEVPVKVIINELVRPSKYYVSIESTKGISTINYVLSDSAEGVEIAYEENFKAVSMVQDLNHFIMSLIYSKRSKKRMRKQFYYLEQIILKAN